MSTHCVLDIILEYNGWRTYAAITQDIYFFMQIRVSCILGTESETHKPSTTEW